MATFKLEGETPDQRFMLWETLEYALPDSTTRGYFFDFSIGCYNKKSGGLAWRIVEISQVLASCKV